MRVAKDQRVDNLQAVSVGKIPTLPVSSNPETFATKGALAYDTTSNQIYYGNDEIWQPVSSEASPALIVSEGGVVRVPACTEMNFDAAQFNITADGTKAVVASTAVPLIVKEDSTVKSTACTTMQFQGTAFDISAFPGGIVVVNDVTSVRHPSGNYVWTQADTSIITTQTNLTSCRVELTYGCYIDKWGFGVWNFLFNVTLGSSTALAPSFRFDIVAAALPLFTANGWINYASGGSFNQTCITYSSTGVVGAGTVEFLSTTVMRFTGAPNLAGISQNLNFTFTLCQ